MSEALIVVDMQNDFIDGSLAVPGATEIIHGIQNKMLAFFRADKFVVLTRDVHPDNHCSFQENGGPFPAHCIQDTFGSNLQAGIAALLSESPDWEIVGKGQRPDKEELSGFCNPHMDIILKENGITDVFVCGLARNYCVEATAQDAERLGYKVTILEDLCRAV